MSSKLRSKIFSVADLPGVQGFECGGDPWHKERALWIKRDATHPQSALQSMREHNTGVWLYYAPPGDLVGYGSLGTTNRPLPPSGKGKPVQLGVIPSLAIQSAFKGQPKDCPREERYAYQIISHLLLRARERGHSIVLVDVHEQNHEARLFYERVGFVAFGNIRQNHLRMFVNLE
jgi:ribosomal protein S18 acetylase RimI-like enzyme